MSISTQCQPAGNLTRHFVEMMMREVVSLPLLIKFIELKPGVSKVLRLTFIRLIRFARYQSSSSCVKNREYVNYQISEEIERFSRYAKHPRITDAMAQIMNKINHSMIKMFGNEEVCQDTCSWK